MSSYRTSQEYSLSIAGKDLIIATARETYFTYVAAEVSACVAITDSDLPSIGDLFPDSDLARCVSKNASMGVKEIIDNNTQWRYSVTCEYSSDTIDVADMVSDPLLKPVQIKISWNKSSENVEKDLDGSTIENTAGFRFQSGISRETTRAVISLTKNYETIDYVAVNALVNTTNDATWLGFAIGMAKMQSVDVSGPFTANNQTYYTISYSAEIASDADGWNALVLNQGSQYYLGGLLLRRAVDDFGQPTDFVLLDMDGDKLDVDVDDPIFLSFRLYESVSWAGVP